MAREKCRRRCLHSVKDKGGADSQDGGNGFDTLAYDGWNFQPQGTTRGITADLALGTVIGPDGSTDTVRGVEGVSGTFRQDQVKGNSLGNKLTGLAGADRNDGRGGFDFASHALDATQGGTDSGHGGAGAGLFVFEGTAFDDDTIDDFSVAKGDRIQFDAAGSFAQLRLFHLAHGVNVQFASGSVTLLGLTMAELSAGDFGF